MISFIIISFGLSESTFCHLPKLYFILYFLYIFWLFFLPYCTSSMILKVLIADILALLYLRRNIFNTSLFNITLIIDFFHKYSLSDLGSVLLFLVCGVLISFLEWSPLFLSCWILLANNFQFWVFNSMEY